MVLTDEAYKQRLVDSFFTEVSKMDHSEVIRLLEFFRGQHYEGKEPAAKVSTGRSKDPFVTPPGSPVMAFGKRVGK
jgi:hypothetical protein